MGHLKVLLHLRRFPLSGHNPPLNQIRDMPSLWDSPRPSSAFVVVREDPWLLLVIGVFSSEFAYLYIHQMTRQIGKEIPRVALPSEEVSASILQARSAF
jgi:hypothetical protein